MPDEWDDRVMAEQRTPIPRAGRRVRIALKEPAWVPGPRTVRIVGTVTPNPDDEGSGIFALNVPGSPVPNRIVPMWLVHSIDGERVYGWYAPKPRSRPSPDREWSVIGSKGDTYLVTRTSNGWSCTCAGFGYRRKCSHIDEIAANTLGV